jgi:mannose-6-phosphate isomerase-like protein (cupin superfamily)
MTVVIEGHMRIQFFKPDAKGKLIPDGSPVDLKAGQTGLIEANRVHDAKYLTACKLVYVHNAAFGFEEKKV